MTLRTRQNLDVGMHGEAFASAKYKRFAAFARTRGNSDIAELLTQAADESRIGYFAREIQLAGLISDDLRNVQDVIRDKQYHTERYRQFAKKQNKMAIPMPPGCLRAWQAMTNALHTILKELLRSARSLKLSIRPELVTGTADDGCY